MPCVCGTPGGDAGPSVTPEHAARSVSALRWEDVQHLFEAEDVGPLPDRSIDGTTLDDVDRVVRAPVWWEPGGPASASGPP